MPSASASIWAAGWLRLSANFLRNTRRCNSLIQSPNRDSARDYWSNYGNHRRMHIACTVTHIVQLQSPSKWLPLLPGRDHSSAGAYTAFVLFWLDHSTLLARVGRVRKSASVKMRKNCNRVDEWTQESTLAVATF